MRATRVLPVLSALAALGAPSSAQVGARLPKTEIVDFAQTKARSLDDFLGRAILLEFFAYW